MGRNAACVRYAEAGRNRRDRRRHHRLVPHASRALQMPAVRHVRAAAEDLDGQDPEVRTARQSPISRLTTHAGHVAVIASQSPGKEHPSGQAVPYHRQPPTPPPAFCAGISVEYLRCTGAFASHGSFRPSDLPCSRTAGITSFTSSSMHRRRSSLRHRAVVAPDAHDAGPRLLDQVLQPRDHLVRRAGDDHRVGDLLLECRIARAGSSPAPPRTRQTRGDRTARNIPTDWPTRDVPGR